MFILPLCVIGMLCSETTVLPGHHVYYFNYPFMMSELFYTNTLDMSISNRKGIWVFLINLLLPCFIEIHEFNANSVDPDQMPRSVVSDQGLHCL